ncbi:MAG: hypothetical protein ACP5FP_05135 [Desulfuromonadaceae bacterium]
MKKTKATLASIAPVSVKPIQDKHTTEQSLTQFADSPPPMNPELCKQLDQYRIDLLFYMDHRIVSSMVDCIDSLLNESERMRKGVA